MAIIPHIFLRGASSNPPPGDYTLRRMKQLQIIAYEQNLTNSQTVPLEPFTFDVTDINVVAVKMIKTQIQVNWKCILSS